MKLGKDGHNRKVGRGTQDLGPWTRNPPPGTQDPGHIGGTREPGPLRGTQDLGPSNWDPLPGTQDPICENLDPIPLHGTRDPYLETLH